MNIAYQASIMARFMTEAQLKNFHQEYEDHLVMKTKGHREPDQLDRLIYEDYKRGVNMRELSRRHKRSTQSISTSIRVVALSQL